MWARCKGRSVSARPRGVSGDPNMNQISGTNRSRADRLSVWIAPTGLGFLYFCVRTDRLDKGCPFG
jgi:hypothetical protein